MYTLVTPQKTEYPVLLQIWESSVRATHHFLQEEDIEFFLGERIFLGQQR